MLWQLKRSTHDAYRLWRGSARVCGVLAVLLLPALIVGSVGVGSHVSAQEPQNRFPFTNNDSFDGTLKTPSEFFGVPLGERFTPHHDVMRYCRYLAEASPRAALVEYGKTVEGRELVLLFVGSEKNIMRLEEIRTDHAQVADPRQLEGDLDEAFYQNLPAVLWFSFNVHGNESSATEAGLRQLYHLLDGNDELSTRIRQDALVIIDPLLNPDGRERYLQWYHSVAQGNPDPQAREHDEPWPGGRTNHYYFDLNRDWAWQSQIETQARLVQYLKWQPLIHVDVHEMSAESSYFFFPAEPPINTNFPEHTLKWGRELGKGNAEAFDRFGWRYFTAEDFDLFYPGYGDSWPSLHGSIGMTFEQAGGSRAGLRYRRRDGSELTLTARVHHHFVACMATLQTCLDRKIELQRSFFEFRKEATQLGEKGGVAEYIFPPARVPQRLAQLATLLVKQGVEVQRTTTEVVAEDLHSFGGSLEGLVKLPAGTLIVSLDQPASRLAKALLEPEAEVTENKFYDVSAWSLPFAMGLSAYSSAKRVSVSRQPWTERQLGKVTAIAEYAYLLEWRGMPAARATLALQKGGITTRLAPEAFTAAGRSYPAGTVVVFVEGKQQLVFEKVTTVARELGVDFYAVDSGWTDKGIDLGSDQIVDLVLPRVAIATGSGISSNSFGSIWYLLEQEVALPFSAFAIADLGSLDLSDYNVLILPSGGGVRRALTPEVLARLKDWIRAGGTCIAAGRSAHALLKEGSGLTHFTAVRPKEEKKKAPTERKKISEIMRHRREHQVPGNIFRVDLDAEHPLSFGLPQSLYAFMSGTESFALTGGAGDVGMLTDDPAVSGYITDPSVAKLKRRLYLGHQSLGRGNIVLFADDPNFRLFWRGSTPLFLNAIFLYSER